MARKERNEVRNVIGLCVDCPRPRKRGHTRCQDCIDRDAMLHRQSRAARKTQATPGKPDYWWM
jgi:hypothetical protein